MERKGSIPQHCRQTSAVYFLSAQCGFFSTLMSKQRIVKDEIWDDEWFYDLDPSEKLVWLFLLTNQRNNIAGVYQLNRRWGANSVGLDRDVFETIITRFEKDKKIKNHEEWVCLQNFHKHQSHNPKVETGVLRILESLPTEIAYILPIDSLCIAYPTLLNSTLLNSLGGKKPQEDSLKDKNKDMGNFDRTADDYEEGVVDLDGDGSLTPTEKPKKIKRNYKEVYGVFFRILGKTPANWLVNATQQKCADNLFTERGLEQIEKALVFYVENKDQEFCPDVSTPYDLDSKWSKLHKFSSK